MGAIPIRGLLIFLSLILTGIAGVCDTLSQLEMLHK